MAKLYLRDVGSHPERDLEVTLFEDGELQFEADNGKYVHINITSAGVKELLDFLIEEIRPTQRAADVCPACRGKRYVKIGMYHEVCEICHGTGKRG